MKTVICDDSTTKSKSKCRQRAIKIAILLLVLIGCIVIWLTNHRDPSFKFDWF